MYPLNAYKESEKVIFDECSDIDIIIALRISENLLRSRDNRFKSLIRRSDYNWHWYREMNSMVPLSSEIGQMVHELFKRGRISGENYKAYWLSDNRQHRVVIDEPLKDNTDR